MRFNLSILKGAASIGFRVLSSFGNRIPGAGFHSVSNENRLPLNLACPFSLLTLNSSFDKLSDAKSFQSHIKSSISTSGTGRIPELSIFSWRSSIVLICVSNLCVRMRTGSKKFKNWMFPSFQLPPPTKNREKRKKDG